MSKFQIFSKLLDFKSYTCLLELHGIRFEGFAVPINGTVWSAMSETRWKVFLFWLNVIFYFGRIKLSSHSRQVFCSCSVSNSTLFRMFCNKKIFLVAPDVFRGGWVGLTENVIFTFYVTNWVWTSPLMKYLS